MVEVLFPSSSVSVSSVVLMYGWLGSIPKHLKKYANLYTERKCAVVYDIASPMTLMSRFRKPLDDIVLKCVKKVCEVIRAVEEEQGHEGKIPIIVHYFSNGGAFVVERLDALIKIARNGSTSEERLYYLDDCTMQDLIFISDRLRDVGYEVADSAPAYLHRHVAFDAIDTTQLNFVLKGLIKLFTLLAHDGYTLFNNMFKRDQEDAVFWRNMIESDLCCRQVFIYSTIDKLTDAVKIDELIVARKERGIHISSLKFDDSDHVTHLRKHPDEYKRIIDQIMSEVS